MEPEQALLLVDAHTRGRGSIRLGLVQRITRWLRGLSQDDFYDFDPSEAVAVVRVAQEALAAQTWAYLDSLGTYAAGDPDLPDEPRGVDPARVWERPAKTYRFERSMGRDHAEALDLAVQRAQTIAEDDLAHAMRISAAQHSQAADGVIGLRRVVHPEMSQGGSCGLCLAASDRIYKVATLLPIHANCVPGDARVAAEGVLGITRRAYAGDFVVLKTASGQKLTVTPNHPVLTLSGWVPAGEVLEGDDLLHHRFGHGVVGRSPHEGDVPPTAEELWRAATVDLGLDATRVPLASQDFYGDGVEGEVDVVSTHGFFARVGDVAFGQPCRHQSLVAGHSPRVPLAGQGSSFESLLGLRDATNGSIGGSGDGGAILAAGADVTLEASGRPVPHRDALLLKAAPDDLPRDFEALCQRELGLALGVSGGDLLVGEGLPAGAKFDPFGLEFRGHGIGAYAALGRSLRDRLSADVEPDRVVHAGRVTGSGHVFDLFTVEGWFSSDSYIVSNCRCTVAEVTNTSDPGNSLNDRSLADLYDAAGSTSAADLKGTRWKVSEHGELGPILVPKKATPRTEADVRRDVGDVMSAAEKARKRLSVGEAKLRELQERAAAGEDVEVQLDYWLGHIETLRSRAA